MTTARPVPDPLLDAAVELVRTEGAAGLTTERLATKARVSKSTIYKRFSDRIDVLAKALHYLDWRPEVDDLGDLRRELIQYQQDRERFFNRPGVARVLIAVLAAATGDAAIRRAATDHMRRQLAVVHEVLQRARQRGDLTTSMSDDTIVTMLCGAAYYRAVVEGRELEPAFLEELVDLVIDRSSAHQLAPAATRRHRTKTPASQ